MSKTILVMEDDKSAARMLRDLLESEGFVVLSAEDAESAVRACEEHSVDLLLLDRLTPKLAGFDLVSQLKLSEKGRAVRIVDCLEKPMNLDRLIDVLHDVLSSAYPAPRRTSAPRSTAEIPLRGDLERVAFAQLFGSLCGANATGTLLLRKSSIKKIVYLRQGAPVFVKSNLLHECLGRIMVSERLITQKECDRSLDKKKTDGKKQGEILVEMGAISAHNLEFALELQMQNKLYDIFSWLEGRYQFNAKDEYDGPQVLLPMSPTAVIYEGASRTMSSERIRRELARIENRFVLPSDGPALRRQATELDPRATRLLDQIDGTRTIHDLLMLADFGRDDAALLLYALACTSLLQLESEVAMPSVSTAEINAIAALEQAGAVLETARETARERLELEAKRLQTPLAERPPVAKREIERRLEEIKKRNYYEVLGVHRKATGEEVRSAYAALADEHHPEHNAVSSSDDHGLLGEEIAVILRRAFAALTDPEARRAYDRRLGDPDAQSGTARLFESEAAFSRGLKEAAAGHWGKAREAFLEAVALHGTEGEFLAELAWAELQANMPDEVAQDRALSVLEHALELSPRAERAYVYRGLIYRAQSRRAEAMRDLKRALHLNPENRDALAALDSLENSGEKKSGLFSRFTFGG